MPRMNRISLIAMVAASLSTSVACAGLSPAEKAAGWRMLFDGSTMEGWRSYRGTDAPKKGWEIKDGALHLASGGGGGDLMTTAQFGEFELALEFKVAPKANSGIIYRATEAHDAPWMTGPEYQVIDDAGWGLGPDNPNAVGACYALVNPPKDKPSVAPDTWHSARIRIRNGVVQHFLDDVKVAEADMNSDDWTARIAASKFKEYAGFGVQPRGHIALQDHGDEVWYRDIRVRELDSAWPSEKAVFSGKDFSGLTAFLNDGGTMEKTWTIEDGVLICHGQPAGYIRTKDTYTNFVLRLQWRFNPVTKQAGNSGVLLRVNGEDKVWPRSIEAQLHSGNAGDFWNIGDFPMQADASRTSGRNTKKLRMAERPLGEWNEYEIICDHGTVTLMVNGEMLNQATNCAEIPGWIALQSEGVEIQFRDVRVAPIP